MLRPWPDLFSIGSSQVLCHCSLACYLCCNKHTTTFKCVRRVRGPGILEMCPWSCLLYAQKWLCHLARTSLFVPGSCATKTAMNREMELNWALINQCAITSGACFSICAGVGCALHAHLVLGDDFAPCLSPLSLRWLHKQKTNTRWRDKRLLRRRHPCSSAASSSLCTSASSSVLRLEERSCAIEVAIKAMSISTALGSTTMDTQSPSLVGFL